MTPESRRLLDTLGILERDDTSSGRWREGVRFAASIVADYLPLIEQTVITAVVARVAAEVRVLQKHDTTGMDCEWNCIPAYSDPTTLDSCRFPDEHGDELVSRDRVLTLVEGVTS